MTVESVGTTGSDALAELESRRVASRLKLYFAILSCLGGLVLATGSDTESIPVIAVFFAVFGYLFVDRHELFALPPIAAYAAMAVAALYCVGNFSDLDSPGNRQMVAVAELLVFVQAILMLQRKSRRIFEQLGVFCLLELIVAAVFNNAINYGLLLIPIGVIGAWALSLLSAVAAWDGLQEPEYLSGDESLSYRREKNTPPLITVTSRESVRSMALSARQLPRIALLTLAPSVLLVGFIFFYALPRTTDAARMTSRGNALVGFSDQMQLEQIGHMMQSSESALRISIQHHGTGQTYDVVGGLYLRGRVLERYHPHLGGGRPAGIWTSISAESSRGLRQLPTEFFSTRSNDRNFFDSVDVEVTCESMRSPSLFAIAPYHRRGSHTDVVHNADRWTLSRRNSEDWVHPRIKYRFGTHGFAKGMQTDLIGRMTTDEHAVMASARYASGHRDYLKTLTDFDIDAIPTADRLAKLVVRKVPADQRTDYQLAKEMERFLAVSGRFGYTLNLNHQPVPGLDAIEQFLSVDRRGHCQYFASALAMMLRSQGIPARVVVGYRTEEYNDLGRYFVARQLHAHAWVEALIHKSQLPETRVAYGQWPNDEYWLRLDPTPGGGGVAGASTGGVGQLIHLTKNIWDEYVVDMDAGQQEDALLSTSGVTPMSESYSRFITTLTDRIARIRAGELGGGSLASRQHFSWPAAIIFFVLSISVFALMKIRAPGWIKRKIQGKMSPRSARSSVSFYAATLEQLARVGIRRGIAQTPAELAGQASQELSHPTCPPVSGPLGILTSAFYQTRFGGDPPAGTADPGSEVQQALADLTRMVDLMTTPTTTKEPPQ